MSTILAFSSDARQLYKADIYRCLSLPNGSIVHFRYDPKYVDPAIKACLEFRVGSAALIFFVPMEKLKSACDWPSIRAATLVRAYTSAQTGHLHVFFRLLEFCSATTPKSIPLKYLPPNIFLTYADRKLDFQPVPWSNRVDAVKHYFEDIPFFIVNDIFDSARRRVDSDRNKLQEESTYTLSRGESYYLSFSVANPWISPTSGDLSISVKDDSNLLVLDPLAKLVVASRYDDHDFYLSPKHTSNPTDISILKIIPTSGNNEMSELTLSLRVRNKTSIVSVLSFAFLTALFGFGGLLGVGKASLPIVPEEFFPVIGLSLVSFSAALFFQLHNKK